MTTTSNQNEINFVKGNTKFEKNIKSSKISQRIDELMWWELLCKTSECRKVSLKLEELSDQYKDDLRVGESLLEQLQDDFLNIETMGQALTTTSTSLPYMVTVSSKLSALSQSYNILVTKYQNKRNDSFVYLSLFLAVLSTFLGIFSFI